MNLKPMKILIIEDDVNDCNSFINCIKQRDDIELVAITDSDIEGLKYVKIKRPEGIVLDLELNNSTNGNTDSLEFLSNLKKLNLNYEPIVIVTTHVNSKRTYEILHREGADLIMYKDQPKYSSEQVLNKFLALRKTISTKNTIQEKLEDEEGKISDCISQELELIGVTAKLKGRIYIHDAILYLIENEKECNPEKDQLTVTKFLTKKYKKIWNNYSQWYAKCYNPRLESFRNRRFRKILHCKNKLSNRHTNTYGICLLLCK